MSLVDWSEEAIPSFRNGTSPIFVAIGVMARGLDVNNIAHVINYDMMEVEAWNHHLLRQLDGGRRLAAPDGGEDGRARRPGAGLADGVGSS
ncbi:hypothetical protein HDK90DRAFT_538091 [Phyllosticta capitalensis]|uniref:Helicase C-terminal domain-containing protein n=1 Tax=Phyllosticta capitalensis TaxID=121624 RepID=A0ABR1Y904_9PEZI